MEIRLQAMKITFVRSPASSAVCFPSNSSWTCLMIFPANNERDVLIVASVVQEQLVWVVVVVGVVIVKYAFYYAKHSAIGPIVTVNDARWSCLRCSPCYSWCCMAWRWQRTTTPGDINYCISNRLRFGANATQSWIIFLFSFSMDEEYE